MSTPDWATAVPSTDEVHTDSTSSTSDWSSAFTRGELVAWIEQFIADIIGKIVSAITGGLISTDDITAILDQLTSWADNIPILGDIIEAITGSSGDLTDLTSFFTDFFSILTGGDSSSTTGILGEVSDFISSFLGQLNIGELSSDAPNKLSDEAATFAAGSIATASDWSVDTTTTRTDDSTGAGKVVADGTPHALRTGSSSTDKLAVGTGQTITGTVSVSYEDYAGSGATVKLQMVPFEGSVKLEPVTLTTTVTVGDQEVITPVVYTPSGDLAWPGEELTGEYVVPEGVTGVQLRILVTEKATAGTLWFDDAYLGKTGDISQGSVSGLTGALDQAYERWQLLIDTISNGLSDAGLSNTALDTLSELLKNINPLSIVGTNGGATLVDTIQNLIDETVGGLVGESGSGASLSDLFNTLKETSTKASQGADSWDVLGIRNNTSLASGLLATARSNLSQASIRAQETPTFLSVTQSATAVASDRVEVSQPCGVIRWWGYGTDGITAFYIDVWKIDGNSRVLAHHSSNLVGNLDPVATVDNPTFMNYLPDPALEQNAGDEFLYEFTPVGGTHHMVCETHGTWAPTDPDATLDSYAYTRNNTTPTSPPDSLNKAFFTATHVVPYFEVAIDLGDTSGYHDPKTVYLGTSERTISVPSWCNEFDRVIVGEGGTGSDGASFGFGGNPGEPGKWNADTLVRGEDFTGDVIITFSPSTRTLSIPGNTLTAVDGADGSGVGSFGTKPVGPGPDELEYGDETYKGGSDQDAWGGDGVPPGGAGNGGSYITGFLTGGGDGAPCGAWVRFRQGEITTGGGEGGGGTPLDTTPPTAPTTITLVSSTPSTLTLTVSGGSD